MFEIYVEHDCGDSYDFSPSKLHPGKINKIIESRYQIFSCDEYHKIKLHNIYEIPNRYQGETIRQSVELNIHLTNNDIISIQMTIDNKVKDAR
jgi:predicted metallopeptidase